VVTGTPAGARASARLRDGTKRMRIIITRLVEGCGTAKAESGRKRTMALKSEFSTQCPCCSATLVVDVNLRRIVRHEAPARGDRPELSDAERILSEEAARREALFQESFAAEQNRGDALSKRFEEALRQARTEPVTKPTRDFDLD
jgi:hypothetical protein